MKLKCIFALLLLSLFFTGCSYADTEETIKDFDILNKCDYQNIGEIRFLLAMISFGNRMEDYAKTAGITKDQIKYQKDEPIDTSGELLNTDKTYVILKFFISNSTNRTINIDINNFCILTRGDNNKIIHSSMPRHCFFDYGENSKLNDSILTLEPKGKAVIYAIYIENEKAVKDHTCYVRVKSNHDTAYFEVYSNLYQWMD